MSSKCKGSKCLRGLRVMGRDVAGFKVSRSRGVKGWSYHTLHYHKFGPFRKSINYMASVSYSYYGELYTFIKLKKSL
jgi:hypothetical protein